MPVTLKDIAEQSGYSVTTVSRALGGFDDVNEETRSRIVEIARQMGYQPNLVARQLQGRRSNTLGIIIPAHSHEFSDDFFSILIRGIVHTAARYQYDLLVSAQPPDADVMEAYRRIVGGNRVDGMIIARTQRDDRRIQYMQSINHPFVVSGRASPDQPSNFPFIDMDSQHGFHLLVDHFVDYGHTHIGLILPPPAIAYTAYRLAGYKEGLDAAGIPYRESYILYGDLSLESGVQAAGALLEAHPEITAIIGANDLMGLGVMQAIQRRGLTVGEDVAVAGFDDIPAAQHAMPPLSTIRQPIYQIGEHLTDMLIQLIRQEPLEETGILLKPELVVRASSGHPRSKS